MGSESFYSIDRLVEFGLSIAVATQMANSMNSALESTYTPGVDAPMRPNTLSGKDAAAMLYVALDGRPAGPFGAAEFSQLVVSGRVTKETYVWMPGLPEWRLVEQVPEALKLVALTPPPIPGLRGESGEGR